MRHLCDANPASANPALWLLRDATPASVIPASAIPATRLPRLRPPRLTLKNPRLPVSLPLSRFLSLTLSLSSSLSLSSHLYIILWRVREFHGFQTFRLSGDLGECSRSRLHLGFPASSGRHVFYSMFLCTLYWAESLYLCMAECQYLDMYCSVTNACTRVVSFLYIYHACDVLYCLIPYLASGPFNLRSLTISKER